MGSELLKMGLEGVCWKDERVTQDSHSFGASSWNLEGPFITQEAAPLGWAIK